MKIIDSHVHLGKFNVSRAGVLGWLDVFPDNLMEYVSREKLSAVWLLSHPRMPGLYDMNGSEETLGLAQSYPVIKPFCQIERAAPECIGRYIDKGCVGIGEIKMPLPINHPVLLKMFRTAKEYGIPVVVHTTDTFCYEDSHTALSEALAVGANIIFHGWGWWNKLVSGEMAPILEKYPNAFMDISANSGYSTACEDINYPQRLFKPFSDRILYGTDFPMLALKSSVVSGSQFGVNKWHLDLINKSLIDDTAKENIMWRNAERLVK